MSTMVSQSTRRVPLARVAVGGIALFFVAAVVVAALTPGYSHIREAISGLAATDNPAGGLMIAGFVAGAVGFAAAAAVFWQRFAGITSGRAAAVMTGLGAAGMLVAGFARQDCSEYRAGCIDAGAAPLASTHFWVHQYVSLLMFVLLTAMMFVLARALRRSGRWAGLARPTRIVGAALVVGTLLLMTVGAGDYSGLAQRVYLGLMAGWPAAVAVLISSRPARSEEAQSEVARSEDAQSA